MNVIPNVIVQLVHIEGPLKGEIQEFNSPEIIIGRHSDCQVQFPKNAVTLSRKHARIVREGNRFKLVDQSTNGTFVNGQQLSEAYLKEGDVITFSEGGPKVSFLTQTSDQPLPPPQMPPPVKPTEPAALPPQSSPAPQHAVQPMPEAPTPPAQPSTTAPPVSDARRTTIPFAVQYGPTLKSFHSLPITLGKGTHCDFVVNHPSLFDQQAQIFFNEDRYWVKDLTGTNAVSINGMPISGIAELQPDMRLCLSPQGPKFRFLGGGRLVEAEEAVPAAPTPAPQAMPAPSIAPGKFDTLSKKAGSLLDILSNLKVAKFLGLDRNRSKISPD